MTEARTAGYGTALAATLLTALGLRLLHLFTSVDNPFFLALSADELYYLDFAKDVANGGLGLGQGLNFMDPLYGYILGAILWLTGDDLFIVRLLQAVVDTLSAYLIYRIGVELQSPRAGLLAAVLYAVCSIAVFYSALLLKTTWVAFFCLLWVWLLLRSEPGGTWRWIGIGAFVSLCVMLRSNLLLLAPATVIWMAWRSWADKSRVGRNLVAFGVGLVLVMSISAWRQQAITGEWQWLPANGGIVLYQVYNPHYAETGRVMPDFVLMLNPREMQSDFMREAEKRTGRSMTLSETDTYFAGEAKRYIRENPAAVARHMSGNLLSFLGGREVANNRSYYVDRQYSSVLGLPLAGYSLLFAVGAVGLAFSAWRNPRSLLLWIPIGIALITYTVFFDFSRFRFPAVPMFAVGGGLLLDRVWDGWVRNQRRTAGIGASLALALWLLSTGLEWRLGDVVIDRQQLADAEVKAGQLSQAEKTLAAALEVDPRNAALYEQLGIIAARREDFDAAIEYNRQALALDQDRHVAWYNLSVAYERAAEPSLAIDAIRAALARRFVPDYRYRLARLLEAVDPAAARDAYEALLRDIPEGSPKHAPVVEGLRRIEGAEAARGRQ